MSSGGSFDIPPANVKSSFQHCASAHEDAHLRTNVADGCVDVGLCARGSE